MSSSDLKNLSLMHTIELYIFKAGISGGVCAIVSAGLNGVDVTKIRMQNQSMVAKELRYKGLISGMAQIYKDEGIAGLRKGKNINH